VGATSLPAANTSADPQDPRLAGHLPVLDGVRGIAILGVVIFHAVAFEVHNRLELAFGMAANFGWAGVDLFFVLSGFLITSILLRARGGANYYRAFYIRRGLRIFPLYFAYCAVLFLVLPTIYGWHSAKSAVLVNAAPWFLTYTLNIKMAMIGRRAAVMGTAFFWSLAVEEQFYLIWPSVVARVRLEHLSRLCLIVAGVALCWRIWMVQRGYTLAAYVLLPSRMDGLALGAWAAIQVSRPGGLDRVARFAMPVLASSAIALLALIAKAGNAGWEKPLMSTLGLTLLAIASTAFIVLAVAGAPSSLLSRAVAVAPLRFFGRYAYGLYVLAGVGGRLVDMSGLSALVGKSALGSPLPNAAWHLALVLLATTGCALVSSWLIERPALSLKRYFPYSESKVAAPAYVLPAPGEAARREGAERIG
jgi:peptidoglycan/LPS O-acetylase OafA/YrhL